MSRLFKTDLSSLKMKLDSGLIEPRQFCELSLLLPRYFVQEAEKH